MAGAPDSQRPDPESEGPTPAPRAGIARIARAVGWSFLGIRRSSGLEEDARIEPLHLVIGAIVGVIVFVLLLVLLVHWVTSSGVAR